MSGGITQLVAIGAQDAHLVGDPQVSFFRSIYKRHTNFSHVVDRQIIQGNPSPGGISTVRLERKGDMVSYIYLTQKDSAGVIENFEASNVIDRVEFLIGGQVIDTQTNDFIQNIAEPYLVTSTTKSALAENSTMYPLHFWFNENWQSALPLVALQYHDVELRVTWASKLPTGKRFECWCDFIYLDTDEREQFASTPQEHLIYQVQKATAPEQGTLNFELNFNHPIKFLAASSNLNANVHTNTLQLQVNGVQVGEPKTYTPHFNIAPQYYHVNHMIGAPYENSFLLPFCLETNKLQPTGTLNFSRLDSVRLVSGGNGTPAGFSPDIPAVYGVNYNVLRIENGMGGLMYAN